MKEIIIASPAPDQLFDFSAQLTTTSGLVVSAAATAEETLAAVGRSSVQLVIVDSRISADHGKQLIRDILMTNAMISTAVMSDMPAHRFHDSMEGLGILMQLPASPGGTEADALWKRFKEVNG